MSDGITVTSQVTTVPENLSVTLPSNPVPAETPDPVAVALRALQARVEDVGVRESRNRGWCGEFSLVLREIFPDGPVDKTPCEQCGHNGEQNPPWRDSDGVDCASHKWRDPDGYDRAGFNEAGWNREGVNARGERKDDPARYRFAPTGYDIDGYDREGRNRHGRTRGEQFPYQIYALDDDGEFRDIDGWSASGYNRAGEYSAQKFRR